MKEQTEKLVNRFNGYLMIAYGTGLKGEPCNTKALAREETKACKKAGLKFVNAGYTQSPDWVKEIEI